MASTLEIFLRWEVAALTLAVFMGGTKPFSSFLIVEGLTIINVKYRQSKHP